MESDASRGIRWQDDSWWTEVTTREILINCKKTNKQTKPLQLIHWISKHRNSASQGPEWCDLNWPCFEEEFGPGDPHGPLSNIYNSTNWSGC